MDWSQVIYIGLLVLAIWTGKPARIITLSMLWDLFATMAFAGDPVAVAVADLVAVVMLAGNGRRANIVACLFVAMQPIYLIGHALGLNNAAIYALVDLISYWQIMVIGGWDVGVGRLHRAFVGRFNRSDSSMVSRRHAFIDMARHPRKVRGG